MTGATARAAAPMFRERLLQSLAAQPGRVCVTIAHGDAEETFTCAQLQARIADFTAFYRDRGVRRGDVVLVVLRESLDLFASFLAGIVAGALPAYFAYPSPKQTADAFLLSVEHLLAANEIPMVVTYPEIVDVLEAGRSRLGARLGRVHDAAAVLRIGSADPVALDGEGAEACLQFSSGTTGAKKGVRISSRALFAQVDAYDECVRLDGASRVVSWLPHYHDMGLIACMLMPLLKQVPIVMLSPFEWVRHPGLLFDSATRHRATHMWLPNFALGHLTRMVPEGALAGYDLGPLRHLVCCSEPVSRAIVRAFVERFRPCGLRDEVVGNCYAMAENTFAITSTPGAVTFLEVDPARLAADGVAAPLAGGKPIASAGRPLRNVELTIAGDGRSPLGEDRVGEVAIRTDCMLDGYHNNPEATREAVSDGWFYTGDLGFVHDGELYITGRKKDLIIVGGENVYPQDVEQILDAEPGLAPGRNVAFGIADERLGTERIVALAETDPRASPVNDATLRQRVFEQLGVSVAEIRLLPPGTLRKSTAGKVSRGPNRDEYLAGAFEARDVRLQDDRIARVVADTIPGREKPAVARDTPLLSSGLIDSLGFTELVLKLEAACGVGIPVELQDRGHFDTIERIAATILALRSGRADTVWEDGHALLASRTASLDGLRRGAPRHYAPPAGTLGWIQGLINKLPIPSSRAYRLLFRWTGMTVGDDLTFLGRVRVRLDGDPRRITFGRGVVVGDGVEIRNRENGRITIGDRVRLDDDVRLVASREGVLEIGEGTALGRGTIVNCGGVVRIGRYGLVSSYVSINASTHGTDRGAFMSSQPFRHGTVEIGDDVWIGSGAVVVLNCRIGEGAIVQSNAMVTGEVPPFAVCGGNPARVERYR